MAEQKTKKTEEKETTKKVAEEVNRKAQKEKLESRRRTRGPLARAASRTGGKAFKHKSRPGKLAFEIKNKDKGKTSDYSIDRIKDFWKNIQKRQAEQLKKARVSTIPAKISHIRVVVDDKGNEAVKVSFAGGGSFHDSGKNIQMFHDIRRKTPPADKIYLLMIAIREKGWRAVEGHIPPELRDEVMKACSSAGVSLTAPGKEEVAQHQQRMQQQNMATATMADDGFMPNIPNNNTNNNRIKNNEEEKQRYNNLSNSLKLPEKRKQKVDDATKQIAQLKDERSGSRNDIQKNRDIRRKLAEAKKEQTASLLDIPEDLIDKYPCFKALSTAMGYATEEQLPELSQLCAEMRVAIERGENPQALLYKNATFKNCDNKRKEDQARKELEEIARLVGKEPEQIDKIDRKKADCIKKWKSLGLSEEEAIRKTEQLYAKSDEEIKKGIEDLDRACSKQKVSMFAKELGIDEKTLEQMSPESDAYKFLQEKSKNVKKGHPDEKEIVTLKNEFDKLFVKTAEQQKAAAQAGQEDQFVKIATALGHSPEKIEELKAMSKDKLEKKSINRAIQYFNRDLKKLPPEEQKKKLQEFVALPEEEQKKIVNPPQPVKKKTEKAPQQTQQPDRQSGQVAFDSNDPPEAAAVKLKHIMAAINQKDNPEYDGLRQALGSKEFGITSVDDLFDKDKLTKAMNNIGKKAYGFDAWNEIRVAKGDKPLTQEEWTRFTTKTKKQPQAQQQGQQQSGATQEKTAPTVEQPAPAQPEAGQGKTSEPSAPAKPEAAQEKAAPAPEQQAPKGAEQAQEKQANETPAPTTAEKPEATQEGQTQAPQQADKAKDEAKAPEAAEKTADKGEKSASGGLSKKLQAKSKEQEEVVLSDSQQRMKSRKPEAKGQQKPASGRGLQWQKKFGRD